MIDLRVTTLVDVTVSDDLFREIVEAVYPPALVFSDSIHLDRRQAPVLDDAVNELIDILLMHDEQGPEIEEALMSADIINIFRG